MIGVSVSRTDQSLTDRHGVYTWYGGTLPYDEPDVSAATTHYGAVAGIDLRLLARGALSVTTVARIHRIDRPENALPYHQMPGIGPVAVYIGAGLGWQFRRSR